MQIAVIRTLALLGACLLLVGMFAPILTIGGSGDVTFWRGAANAPLIAFLAVLSAVLAFGDWFKQVFWPGLISAAVLSATYFRIDQIQNLAVGTTGSPATIGEALVAASELRWGWFLLAAGAALLTVAGWLAPFHVKKAQLEAES